MFTMKEEELSPAGGALVPAGRGHFALQKGKSAEMVMEEAIGMMVQGVYLYLLLVCCILHLCRILSFRILYFSLLWESLQQWWLSKKRRSLARWCLEYSSLYISVFVHCMCCVFLPVFDPHSAACRGGGGGDRWHHGRCAGNFVFLYFVFIVFDPHSAACAVCRGGGKLLDITGLHDRHNCMIGSKSMLCYLCNTHVTPLRHTHET